MKKLLLILCLLGIVSIAAKAQDIEDDEGALVETEAFEDNATLSLVLDNTRTKQGRDFYELFYQRFASAQTQPDSVLLSLNQKLGKANSSAIEDEFTITIDELPTNNGFSTIVNISINDILVWQQFVQPRFDVLDALSANASEVVQAYIADFQNVMNQLGTEDQAGSGIF